MVIVNWTLCITFGIFKLFVQWSFYFVTLVRVWKAPWRTVWNECRIVLKICHSLRTMLKICSMTNWNPISAISYAHLPISLHQLWEVCRVLLLRSNNFDDWPSSIAKRCSLKWCSLFSKRGNSWPLMTPRWPHYWSHLKITTLYFL